MDLKKGASALALCMATASANAATVFAVTDGDANFFDISLASGTTLAMFDDDDSGSFITPLDIPLPSLVTVAPKADASGDFLATGTSGSITLTDNPWFVLAVSTDGGTTWTGDSSVSCNAISNSCVVSFSDGSVLSVDVAVVPLPAAAWLFGSGLLGLAGIARRRTS